MPNICCALLSGARPGATTGIVLAARIRSLRRALAGALAAALVLPATALAAGDPAPTAAQLEAAGVHQIIVKRRPGSTRAAAPRSAPPPT